jgi:glucose-6-phosphate isomerase
MEIELKNPDIRRLKDMEDVLYNKEIVKNDPDREMYYMYRGVDRKDTLRYDITVIPPFLMGEEYTKTLGHFHGENNNEMYIILEGEAIWIFQKGKDVIEDFYVVRGKKGNCVIVPRGYAHVTINATNETLKMANWANKESGFDYQTVKDRKGLCYYYTVNGWIKNNAYKNIPEIKFEEPLKEVPQNLDFLK